jgi:hypothetical protein
MTRAGMIRKACSILVMKPKPTSVPARTNHLVWAFSSARTRAYMEPARRSARRLSGLLKRNIIAATGVRTTTAPAKRAAWAVNQRRTVR